MHARVKHRTHVRGDTIRASWRPARLLLVMVLSLPAAAFAQVVSDDFERPALLKSDVPSGAWDAVEIFGANTVEVNTQAAHRGTGGLRIVDVEQSTKQTGREGGDLRFDLSVSAGDYLRTTPRGCWSCSSSRRPVQHSGGERCR